MGYSYPLRDLNEFLPNGHGWRARLCPRCSFSLARYSAWLRRFRCYGPSFTFPWPKQDEPESLRESLPECELELPSGQYRVLVRPAPRN